MLQAGDKAPEFHLPDSDMSMTDSTEFAGKPYVIYFYPKDDTPGCTMEGLEFTELSGDFEALGAAVIGVSKDTCVSHAAFRDKYGLSIRLVADVKPPPRDGDATLVSLVCLDDDNQGRGVELLWELELGVIGLVPNFVVLVLFSVLGSGPTPETLRRFELSPRD